MSGLWGGVWWEEKDEGEDGGRMVEEGLWMEKGGEGFGGFELVEEG